MAKLAIRGGEPIRRKPWPQWPIADSKDAQAVANVVLSGQWGRVRREESLASEFERRYAEYQGAKYALMINGGGTQALELSFRALGLGTGDEVILPALGWVADVTSLLMSGCIPIFVDVDIDTGNIDPDLIEDAITDQTRAILPVHTGGRPCEMDRIIKVAERNNLFVVEDAAHGSGATYRNRGLGTIGDMGGVSLQSSKPLTCGEGGIVLTNNIELWRTACELTDPWAGPAWSWFEETVLKREPEGFRRISSTRRVTELQAALALSQLDKLEEWTKRRAENGEYLNEELSKIDGIKTPRKDPNITRRSYYYYRFRYLGFDGLSRNRFIDCMKAEGIPCLVGDDVRPLYELPILTNPDMGLIKGYPIDKCFYGKTIDYRKVRCPKAERLSRRESVWIFQTALLGEKSDVDDVVAAVWKIKENAKEAMN